MRFDGFVSHVSLTAGCLAAVCLLFALVTASVVSAHRLGAAFHHAPVAAGHAQPLLNSWG